MAGPILLTVDLGTTNCKAQAFTLDGTSLASASIGYPTHNPREGWYEQAVADWRDAITRAVNQVAAEIGADRDQIAGLGLSAWGPGLVLLDGDLEPLNDRSPTWQDTRSLTHGEHLLSEVGPGWIGGGLPQTGFPAKLAWATDTWPELASAAAFAVGVKDYLLLWLTGVLSTEPSSGPYGDAWPTDVFESIGWDLDRLPRVHASTDVLGPLPAARAAELGLPGGIPVIAGINDGAAATLGVGAHNEGDVVVSLGTNGVLRLLTRVPPTAARCLASSLFRYPLLNDVWVTGGFVLSGGSALSWLASATGPTGAPTAIEVLLEDATNVPAGSDGVIFLPHLVGRGSPHPDPAAAGAFLGLRPRHGRGHLTRAVLEGVAFGLNDIAREISTLGVPLARLRITGGGATSPLWRDIISAVLDLPATYTTGDSNLGSAITLAVALDLIPDLDTAVARFVPSTSGEIPAPPEPGIYDSAYRSYLSALSVNGRTGP